MNLLPFGKLPTHKPRTFVPQTIDLGDWLQIAPLFDRLETRAAQGKSAADLERWLLDWSELTAALDEESSRRYIAMTCHTDNAEAEKAYLHFVENVEPQLKPRQFALERIYIRRRDDLHESQTSPATGKNKGTREARPSESVSVQPSLLCVSFVTAMFNFTASPSRTTNVSVRTCKPSSNENFGARSLAISPRRLRSPAPNIWPLMSEP